VITEVFSTITSPVFSELAIVITADTLPYVSRDASLFETLRRMNGVKPFKPVFRLEATHHHMEKLRRDLEVALDLATAQVPLDPSIPYPPSVGQDLPTADGSCRSPTSTGCRVQCVVVPHN